MPHLLQITIPGSSTEKCRQLSQWRGWTKAGVYSSHLPLGVARTYRLQAHHYHYGQLPPPSPQLGNQEWGLSASEPSIT